MNTGLIKGMNILQMKMMNTMSTKTLLQLLVQIAIILIQKLIPIMKFKNIVIILCIN